MKKATRHRGMAYAAKGSWLALGTALMAAAMPAHAQTAPDAQASDAQAADTAEPGDIIVTATRRSENVQDVPLSIAAFSADALKERAATRLEDVMVSVPNVSYSGSSSTRASYISIRGVQGSNEEPAVGFYLDNVYVGRRTAQNLDFLYPDSVQVLRGPQGALYGKNTLGGVIVVDTRKPSLTETNVLADVTMGTYGLIRGTAVVSTPLGEGAALLVGARGSMRHGYYHNVKNGTDVGDRDSYGFVSTLSAESGIFRIDLTGDYSHDESEGQVLKVSRFRDTFTLAAPVQPPLVFGAGDYVADTKSYDVSVDQPGFETRRVYGVTANMKFDLGGFDLRSTTAYRGFTINYGADSDGTGLPLLFNVQNQKQDQYSQELTLVSDTGGMLDWIVGASYYHEQFVYDPTVIDTSGRGLGIKPLLLGGLVPFGLSSHADTRTDSYAAYAEATVHLSRAFSIRAGLRYARDDRQISKREVYTVRYGTPTAAPLGAPFVPAVFPANPLTTNQHRSDDALIPDLVLRYEFTPDVSLYVKASNSYRPGGFNDSPALTTSIQYNKERARSYEAGLRTQFLDRQLTLNLTGFYIDWKDLQVLVSCTAGYCNANAQARADGLELETRYAPSKNFSIGASASYLIDAKFNSNTLLQVRNPVTGGTGAQNVNGIRLARAPKFSASTFAQISAPLGHDRTLTLRGDLAYKSKELIVQGREDFQSPAYTQIDLRAAIENEHVGVALWTKNLLNKGFWSFGNSASYGDVFSLSDPRTIGFTVSVKY